MHFSLNKLIVSWSLVLATYAVSACYYKNNEAEINQQLDRMLSSIENIKKATKERSRLFEKMNTGNDIALVWNIFAYCVIDDNKISVPFDIVSNLNYNQLKAGIPSVDTKKKSAYLLSIFYATTKDKSKMGFVRKRELAFKYLDDYFKSVGVSEDKGKDLIFKTVLVQETQTENEEELQKYLAQKTKDNKSIMDDEQPLLKKSGN